MHNSVAALCCQTENNSFRTQNPHGVVWPEGPSVIKLMFFSVERTHSYSSFDDIKDFGRWKGK